MSIFSPMARGNGAYVVHEQLSTAIDGYTISGFDPRLSIVPAFTRFTRRECNITHTVPEYGASAKYPTSHLAITFHNYLLDAEYMRRASRTQRAYYRFIVKPATRASVEHAHVLTAVSDFTAALVKKDLHLKNNIQVIKNGVDTDLFKPSPNTPNDERLTLLFAGNPTTRKGGHLLSELAQALPNNVTLAYTAGLRDMDIPTNDKLRKIPRVAHNEMAKLYNMHDALIFPSYREGLSLVVLEAMACGLPIISWDSSSMSELIDNEHGGYLSASDDLIQMRRNIERLAKEPILRQDMSNHNREKILREFRLESMIGQYKSLFESISDN